MTVRNEELYVSKVIEHLHHQGIEICLIDNGSTDNTLNIARSYVQKGIFQIESLPYHGCFELVKVLENEERLARKIKADWFIHHDADEIREAPAPLKSLSEGIRKADQEGYNAINFDEFVFLPTADDESFEGTDYVEKMRYYYFFEPGPLRRVNAWKNNDQAVDLVSSGGHSANFDGRKIYPQNFILRHYIVLSRAQAIAKYGSERVYSREEVQRGWHGARTCFNSSRLQFPSKHQLKMLRYPSGWDKSAPVKIHSFLQTGNSSD
jgi:glycosyltransferase involved in cell wall biosynthesis